MVKCFIVGLAALMSATALAQHKPLFNGGDYPREALRKGEGGVVKAKLRISKKGRVIGCEIVESASPILDEATCRLLTKRARFTPAQDKGGDPVEDDYLTPPIHWVPPRNSPLEVKAIPARETGPLAGKR